VTIFASSQVWRDTRRVPHGVCYANQTERAHCTTQGQPSNSRPGPS